MFGTQTVSDMKLQVQIFCVYTLILWKFDYPLSTDGKLSKKQTFLNL